MVIITDIMPKILETIYVNRLIPGKSQEMSAREIIITGAGIETSQRFNEWNSDYQYLAFIGGTYKNKIEEVLNKKQVSHRLIDIKDELPMTVNVREQKRHTILEERDLKITREEFENFYYEYKLLLSMTDQVLILKEAQEKVEFSMVKNLVSIANVQHVPVFMEVDNATLEKLATLELTGVYLRKEELEKIDKKGKITNSIDIFTGMRPLIEKGIQFIAVPVNEKKLCFYVDGKKLQIKNSYGGKLKLRGDYLLNGYLIAKNRNYDEELCIKMATALGVLGENKKEKSSAVKEMMNYLEII